MKKRYLAHAAILAFAAVASSLSTSRASEPVLWVYELNSRPVELDVSAEDAQKASDIWLGCEVFGALYNGLVPGDTVNSSSGAIGTPQLLGWARKMREFGLNPGDDGDRISFAFWLKDNSRSGWNNWQHCNAVAEAGYTNAQKLQRKETGELARGIPSGEDPD